MLEQWYEEPVFIPAFFADILKEEIEKEIILQILEELKNLKKEPVLTLEFK